MSNLPDDLLDNTAGFRVEPSEMSPRHRPRQTPKIVVSLGILLLLAACFFVVGMISWVVFDVRSAGEAPVADRMNALDSAVAELTSERAKQEKLLNELQSKISGLEKSIHGMADSMRTDMHGLNSEVEVAKKQIADIKSYLQKKPTAQAPSRPDAKESTRTKTPIAPSAPTARIYAIKTQGEKAWVTLTEGGRISHSLTEGDTWNQLKITKIHNTSVTLEFNKKPFTLYL
jgi:uncharacterized coiled-coil protein SlyX